MCLRSPARHRGARLCIQTPSNALCLSLLLSSGEPPHISLQNETMWGISQQLFPRGWNMSLTNITHKIACFLAIFLAKYLSAVLPGGYLRPCCFVLTMSCFRASKAPPCLVLLHLHRATVYFFMSLPPIVSGIRFLSWISVPSAAPHPRQSPCGAAVHLNWFRM